MSALEEFRTVSLTTRAQYAEAAALYRAVFGYTHPEYGLNPRLLGALAGNGGSVVGVLDASERMVAFAYGFCGTDGRGFYHYSQSAVVDAEHQGRGLGRLLKHAQREVAREYGMTHMRWTYDPLQTRNAHFNLDVLGARGRWFHPDLYGEPGTDRVVVEWNLQQDQPAGPPVKAPVELGGDQAAELGGGPAVDLSAPGSEAVRGDGDRPWGVVGGDSDRPWLAVPADFAGLAAARPEVAEQVRRDVRAAFTDLLGKDLAAVSCQRMTDDTAVYRFGPPPKLAPTPSAPISEGPASEGGS